MSNNESIPEVYEHKPLFRRAVNILVASAALAGAGTMLTVLPDMEIGDYTFDLMDNIGYTMAGVGIAGLFYGTFGPLYQSSQTERE